MPMPKIFFKQIAVLVKKEATYAVDPTPLAANGVMTTDFSFTPMEATSVESNIDRPDLGNSGVALTAIKGKIEFKVELAPNVTGMINPAWADVIEACKCKLIAAPDVDPLIAHIKVSHDSNGQDSVAIYIKRGLNRYRFLGCMGDVSVDVQGGARPYLVFSFTGLYTTPDATAVPDPDWSGFQRALIVQASNSQFDVAGQADVVMHSLKYAAGNQVTHRDITGSNEITITDRKPTANFVIDEPPVSVVNFYSLAETEAITTAFFTLGTGTGVKVEMDINGQTLDPKQADKDSISTLDVPILPLSAAGTTDQEWEIRLF